MNKIKVVVAMVGVAAVLTILAACGNGEAATSPEPSSNDSQAGATTGGELTPSTGAPATPDPATTIVTTVVGTAPAPAVAMARVPSGPASSASAPLLSAGVSQAGIWVTGEATITQVPDLVLLNVGIETTAETVAQARDEGATAMDAIVKALRARKIESKDIQTQFFNISPMYEFQEVINLGRRTNKQVLVGYRVSNTAAIKIRDLAAVGDIIDEVATAGGDATRINGISFTVEDPKPLMAQLREDAVKDALAKAQQLANLTEVSLGRLVFISESGRGGPVIETFAEEAFAVRALAAPSTSISGGELTLRMSVQAVFNIE